MLIAEAPFPRDYPAKPDPGKKPGDFDPNRLFVAEAVGEVDVTSS
jgi:hypothetical protein